jgi:hypothetical protein
MTVDDEPETIRNETVFSYSFWCYASILVESGGKCFCQMNPVCCYNSDFEIKESIYLYLCMYARIYHSVCLSIIYLSVSVYLFIYGSTVLLLDLGPFFSFLILYTVGRTFSTGNQPVARQVPTYRTMQKQNKRTQSCMPQVGLEPMIPVFERAIRVHALDRAAISRIRGKTAIQQDLR